MNSAAKLAWLTGAMLSMIVGVPAVAHAQPQPQVGTQATYTFNLPVQSLGKSLRQLGSVAGLNVVYDPATVKGRSGPAVAGRHSASSALSLLLAGSGLTAEFTSRNTVVIKRAAQPASRKPAEGAGANEPSRTLGTVTVIGHIKSLSATRADTPIREIPQTVSVVSEQTFDQQNATNVYSALQQEPGVTLLTNNSQQSQIYIRGFNVGAIRIDGGAPVFNLTGSVGAMSRDIAEYDSVDVLQGSDALFGGNGTPGGTVSVQRKMPTPYFQASASMSLGSWDQRRVVGDVSGPLTGQLSGRAVVALESRDYFYDTANDRHQFVYGVLKYDFGPATNVSLGGSYERDNAVPYFGGLPWYSNGVNPNLSRKLALTLPWEKDSHSFTEVFGKLVHQFNDDWKLSVNATYLKEAMPTLITTTYRGPINPTTGLLPGTVGFYPSKVSVNNVQKLADAVLTGKFEWLGHTQQVMFGGDYQHSPWSTTGWRFRPVGPAIDPFNFDSGLYPEPNLSLDAATIVTPNSVNQTQWGLYGSVRFVPADRIAFTVGGRLSNYRERITTQLLMPAFHYTSPVYDTAFEYKGKFTPYAGVTYDLSKHYTAYASYTVIYNPNGGSFGPDGSQLPPMNGVTREVGVKGAWLGNMVNGAVALFKTNEEGVAVFDPSVPQSANGDCCFLTESIRSKGLSVNLSGVLTPRWTITTGYTYLEHVGLNALTTAEMPKNSFKLWTNYVLPDPRWSIGGGLRMFSANMVVECWPEFGSPCNRVTMKQGAYSVADLRGAYELARHWTVSLNLNNVFDRKYFQTLYQLQAGNWYGAPRNFMVKLRGEW